MQSRNLLMLGVALFLGFVAVYVLNSYFNARQQQQEQVARQAMMARIVVASQDVAFGSPLNGQNVRLANWPADSVPAGAFTSLDTATRNRAALRPIVTGEPILTSKVSGSDNRATIAANLPAGKLAFAVPLNDQTGVGGFVRPGDSVDVLITRQLPGSGMTSDKITDVLLQAVRVIGVDQVADESKTQPVVSKTATLEVDAVGAQKLALATQMGTISLALRNVADQSHPAPVTVSPRDLTAGRVMLAEARPGPSSPPARPRSPMRSVRPQMPRFSSPAMMIVRGVKPMEYEVQHGY
ncbi:Flp pilus assembly protein CpaB [Novosphingobium rosa]|uniref:Flp pilus assembly protein CpaB n=1 Tax=Novosphingobium rosa TaxID=76978 RepID=UPI00082E6AE6|nr:Flp pilus assembly protein CpaB [Novosphingobium rosa]